MKLSYLNPNPYPLRTLYLWGDHHAKSACAVVNIIFKKLYRILACIHTNPMKSE